MTPRVLHGDTEAGSGAGHIAALWIPVVGPSVPVIVVHRPHYDLEVNRSWTWTGVLEVGLPSVIDLHVLPEVRWGAGAGCGACGNELAVQCQGMEGTVLLAPAHERQSMRLNIPNLEPRYFAGDAISPDRRTVGEFDLEPLSAVGILVTEAGGYALWCDSAGEPRGWEAYRPETLAKEHQAVAGSQLMVVDGLVRGFAEPGVVAEVSDVLAASYYHAAIASF